jgi:hypothetical protein
MVSLTSTFAETRVHIARARELHEALAPILAQSRALVVRSRGLCRVFRRRISGGSDLEAPVALTRNEAIWQFLEMHRGEMFCTQCIATALLATKRIDRKLDPSR